MIGSQQTTIILLSVLVSVGLIAGCGDDLEMESTVLGAPPTKGASKSKARKAVEAKKADAGVDLDASLKEEEEEEEGADGYTDEHFVELDIQNRDPFRSFAHQFKSQATAPAQRKVLISDASLDEMRLVAIITGGDKPRAMLTDPRGIGHVIKRGDFIGRPEVVQVGGDEAMPITLNWRVDRIRPTALVLTREDPTDPERPPLTRVMPLNDEEEADR